MKILKFILALAATWALIYFLSRPLSLNDPDKTTLPPLGHFFNPFEGFWQNAEAMVGRQYFTSFEVPDRQNKITVHFDERMVPHIFAQTTEDAMFAQGYIEAGMRLWQMDMLARVSSGRLAEIMGEDLLETDKLMRRRGMLFAAQNHESAWKESTEAMKLLTAYTDGVNAWIDRLEPKDYPLEFKLLNYQPERWSVLKTALVRQYMNLTLNFKENDVEASNAMQVFGPDIFKKLFPERNPKQQPIIPAGTKWNFEPIQPSTPKQQKNQQIQEALGVIPNRMDKGSHELVGSNNWAVAGKKTKSGKPILCNDPHLQLSLPSIWFELQIHTPESNSYGVSIPGMPNIIIGFNQHIAWGVTNAGIDVADWYKIEWGNAEKTTYLMDGAAKEVKTVIEQFRVKGMENPVLDTVKWTDWGPVVYESEESGWKDLALRWLSHDKPPAEEIMTFTNLAQGKNYNDYRSALKKYVYPAQNFVFADRSGDIAITVNGRFPLKKQGQGSFAQNGNSSENAWGGFIPMEHVPSVKNPYRGFVGSANQRSTDFDYPYYYNAAGFDHYRGRVLFDALSKMDSIEVEDMMALQLFNYSIHAEEALKAMLPLVDTLKLTERERLAFEKMANWDFSFDKEKVEPAIFQNWWDSYYELAFDEIMVFNDSIPMLQPQPWRLIEMTEKMPKDDIFDYQETPEKETAAEIATFSFKKTCEDMTADLLNPLFNWATHKKTSIMHMTRIPAFSRMDLDVGGYRQALNAISEKNGPSWRMIVELGDEVKGWGVFPGGQSGNPGSRFYDLDVDTWKEGKYNQLFFMKDAFDTSQTVAYSIEIN